MNNSPYKLPEGAGGTPGGCLEFMIGAVMIVVGGYLFTNRLMVTTRLQTLWSGGFSGIAILLVLIGIGVLFFSGKSWLGWLLVAAGSVVILFDVIQSFVIYFQPTSLFQTLLMLGLIFGGLGLVARSLTPHNKTKRL
jgi:hypothetical protein